MKAKYKLIIAIVIIVLLIGLRAYNMNNSINNDNKELSLPSVSDILDTNKASELEAVTVESVVDGDTIYVNKNNQKVKIRFIGCNTPESVSSNTNKNCAEGKKASEYTKSVLTTGKTVYLQYDTGKEDKYGRTLAYIWLKNNIDTNNESDIEKYMYNAQLISKGYAETMFVSPNYHYEKEFKEIEKQAISNNTGFWENGVFDQNHTK